MVELYEPLADELGLRLEVTERATATLSGDRHLMFQGLVNLLDNAVKFSPAQGRIAVSLAREGARAVLAVCDKGPGIPEEARVRVRGRFVRLEDNEPGLRASLRLPLPPASHKAPAGQASQAKALPSTGHTPVTDS